MPPFHDVFQAADRRIPASRPIRSRRPPDDLNALHDRQGELPVRPEVLASSPTGEGDRVIGRVEHMPQANAVLRPHTAPWRRPATSWRKYGSVLGGSQIDLPPTMPPSSRSMAASGTSRGRGRGRTRSGLHVAVGRKSSRRTEPKSARRRMWCRRQNSATRCASMSILLAIGRGSRNCCRRFYSADSFSCRATFGAKRPAALREAAARLQYVMDGAKDGQDDQSADLRHDMIRRAAGISIGTASRERSYGIDWTLAHQCPHACHIEEPSGTSMTYCSLARGPQATPAGFAPRWPHRKRSASRISGSNSGARPMASNIDIDAHRSPVLAATPHRRLRSRSVLPRGFPPDSDVDVLIEFDRHVPVVRLAP